MKISHSELESSIVAKIMKALTSLGFAFKVHGGRFQTAGIPDILFWRNGVGYAFEVKRPDESWGVTELQRITMDAMQKQGVVVAVVHSVEETLAIIGSFSNADAIEQVKTRAHLDFSSPDTEILTEDITEFLGQNKGGIA